MKKHLVLFLLLSLPFATQAQGILFGFDAGYGVPVGDFGDIRKGGVGGELRARFYPKDNFMVGINAGYYYYTGKALKSESPLINYKEGSSQLIPVTLSFEYFLFTKIVKPYVGLDLGLYYTNFSDAFSVNNYNNKISYEHANFGFAPNVGVMIGAGGTNLNACIKYVNIFNDQAKMDPYVTYDIKTSSMLLYQLGIAFKIGL